MDKLSKHGLIFGLLGPKPLSSSLLSQMGGLSVLELQDPGQQQALPSHLTVLLTFSLLGETEARRRVGAGSVWQRYLPRRQHGQVPRQGWSFVNCASVRLPQAGWVKGGWLAASHPLPRQRGLKQWAFVPCVGVLSRCKPWPCARASASSRVWKGWPRRPKGPGQPADREPASLSLPHRGSPSPERALWVSRHTAHGWWGRLVT